MAKGIVHSRGAIAMAQNSTGACSGEITPPDAAPDVHLWQRIQMACSRALGSGALLNTDSNDSLIEDGGSEFVVGVPATDRPQQAGVAKQALSAEPIAHRW